jgi:hypothetical protein
MSDETEEKYLIDKARQQFRESPGWDIGVNPDSVMDVHRRLADALEARITDPGGKA